MISIFTETLFLLDTADNAGVGKTGSPAAPGLFQTMFLLIACVAIIVAAYYTAKFVARKAGASATSKHMRVVDRMSLANDKQVLLVKVGKKIHIVGMTSHQINGIGELDADELNLNESEIERPNSKDVLSDFTSRLKGSLPFGNKKQPRQPRNRVQPKQNDTSFSQTFNQTQQQEAEPEQVRPVRSGLDTLDDMVSNRKDRFRSKDQGGDRR